LTHGCGIYLIKVLMDEFCFEERGAVVMRKKSNASLAEERKPQ
jgi:anti-sigma regulatory factor (Ser/Thr protein kinase)